MARPMDHYTAISAATSLDSGSSAHAIKTTTGENGGQHSAIVT